MRGLVLAAVLLLTACSRTTTAMPEVDAARTREEAEIQLRLAMGAAMHSAGPMRHRTPSPGDLAYFQRLYAIGARVLEANAPLCETRTRWDLGVLIMNRFDVPPAFAEHYLRAYGQGDGMTVVAAAGSDAPDRPQPGDALLAVDGDPVPSGRGGVAMLEARLRGALGDRPAVLSLTRDGRPLDLTVRPVPRCDYEMRIDRASVVNAYADGRSIRFTTGMMDFSSDDELALIFGHELGHNAMAHLDKREENARAASRVGGLLDFLTGASHLHGYWGETGRGAYSRDFEAEADYVGIYYAARAGYDVTAAMAFWRRLASVDPRTITMSSTHPTSPQRFVALEAAGREIESKRRSGAELRPEFRKR